MVATLTSQLTTAKAQQKKLGVLLSSQKGGEYSRDDAVDRGQTSCYTMKHADDEGEEKEEEEAETEDESDADEKDDEGIAKDTESDEV